MTTLVIAVAAMMIGAVVGSHRSPHLRNGLVGAAFALPDPQWNENGFA